MYEFCINCARILLNVDKDLLDLLIYAGICWSASSSTCLYLFVSFGVCAFSAVEPSAAKRSEAVLRICKENLQKTLRNHVEIHAKINEKS